MDRRQFLTATTVTGTTLLAGCGASTDSTGTTTGDGTPGDSTEPTDSGAGSFRLLISDQPADIGDFDSLDVTFDRARVHSQQSGDGEAESDEGDDTESETDTTEATDTTDTEEQGDADEERDADDNSDTDAAADSETDDADDSERGFTVFDLDEPTVDLTQVVGDRAIGVLDGELEPGQYSKIELYVSAVDGVVDGESVDVKVPSNKLQITKPFEITSGGTVEFVFDINVVKKGNGGYNLLPVISESGVAGEDVEVEEVDADEATESETGTENGSETGTETPTATDA